MLIICFQIKTFHNHLMLIQKLKVSEKKVKDLNFIFRVITIILLMIFKTIYAILTDITINRVSYYINFLYG